MSDLEKIKQISPKTWQEIVKLLGSGNFIKIEFRAPETDDELALGEMCGFRRNGTPGWWICEATYHEYHAKPNHSGTWQQVVQKVPFRLYEDAVS